MLYNFICIQQNREGCTPLLWACKNEHSEIAKLLIKKGANIEMVDKVLIRFNIIIILECIMLSLQQILGYNCRGKYGIITKEYDIAILLKKIFSL